MTYAINNLLKYWLRLSFFFWKNIKTYKWCYLYHISFWKVFQMFETNIFSILWKLKFNLFLIHSLKFMNKIIFSLKKWLWLRSIVCPLVGSIPTSVSVFFIVVVFLFRIKKNWEFFLRLSFYTCTCFSLYIFNFLHIFYCSILSRRSFYGANLTTKVDDDVIL